MPIKTKSQDLPSKIMIDLWNIKSARRNETKLIKTSGCFERESAPMKVGNFKFNLAQCLVHLLFDELDPAIVRFMCLAFNR